MGFEYMSQEEGYDDLVAELRQLDSVGSSLARLCQREDLSDVGAGGRWRECDSLPSGS